MLKKIENTADERTITITNNSVKLGRKFGNDKRKYTREKKIFKNYKSGVRYTLEGDFYVRPKREAEA